MSDQPNVGLCDDAHFYCRADENTCGKCTCGVCFESIGPKSDSDAPTGFGTYLEMNSLPVVTRKLLCTTVFLEQNNSPVQTDHSVRVSGSVGSANRTTGAARSTCRHGIRWVLQECQLTFRYFVGRPARVIRNTGSRTAATTGRRRSRRDAA